MKTKQTAVLVTVLSLCLISSIPGVVFAESQNWVEVVTFSEEQPRFGETDSFTIEHIEWRVLWEYEIDEPNLTAFFFDVKNNDTHQIVGNYNNTVNLNLTQGIYNITGPIGDFYLDFGSNGLSYSITIEQNIDSVPEFGSWIILPVTFTAALFVVIFKKRYHQLNS